MEHGEEAHTVGMYIGGRRRAGGRGTHSRNVHRRATWSRGKRHTQ